MKDGILGKRDNTGGYSWRRAPRGVSAGPARARAWAKLEDVAAAEARAEHVRPTHTDGGGGGDVGGDRDEFGSVEDASEEEKISEKMEAQPSVTHYEFNAPPPKVMRPASRFAPPPQPGVIFHAVPLVAADPLHAVRKLLPTIRVLAPNLRLNLRLPVAMPRT